MIIRKLNQDKYHSFKQQLIQKAQSDPSDASYSINMIVNKAEYLFKVQPDKKHKIVALQALKIERNEQGQIFELITDNIILSSLLELIIHQGVE